MNQKASNPSSPSIVLIVEDDPLMIALYKAALSHINGIRIVIAVNGFQGLLQICRYNPEVIITDLDMPEFDGFKMVGIIRADPAHRDAPLIVISGLNEADLESNGGLPQGVAYIQKQDFSAAQLQALVKRGIANRAVESTLSRVDEAFTDTADPVGANHAALDKPFEP